MGDFIVQSDLEDRMSATIVRRILDDNNDGTADATPVERAIADAESLFISFIVGIYDLPLPTELQPEAKRLCLDAAEAYLWRRHPEIVRGDYFEAMKLVRTEMKDLRTALTRLSAKTPAPANVGGKVISGNADDPTPVCHTWRSGFGIY